jgi:hypothetical protein
MRFRSFARLLVDQKSYADSEDQDKEHIDVEKHSVYDDAAHLDDIVG